MTLRAEQQLDASGLIAFFENSRETWITAARDTHAFVKQSFPAGSKIRPDDVAKALLPVLEVNQDLRNQLDADRLKQKYWVSYFTDLVIDRCWDGIITESGNDEAAAGAT